MTFNVQFIFHVCHYLLYFVQDLSRLGRKLERIIIVDNSPASYIFHQDNAVRINKVLMLSAKHGYFIKG